MIARIAPVLLALCLLAAWQSAALHPLQHVDADGALVHIDPQHPKHGGRSSSDPSFKLCNALAALTACVGGSPTVLAAILSVDTPLSHRSAVARAASAPPFLAQGPPWLL